MTTVQIVEVAARDGIQNEKRNLPTRTKLELIKRLAAAGVSRLEATSFVRPTVIPQLADAQDLMRILGRPKGVSLIGVALNRHGVDRALRAGVREVNYVIAATDDFALRNQGCDTASALQSFKDSALMIHESGCKTTLSVAVAFGCPYSGEVPQRDVARLVDMAVSSATIDEVLLADTIGAAVPADVEAMVASIGRIAGNIPLRMHFHNTRNAGYANAIAAVGAGIRVLDSSVGGIGGCPFAPGANGNIATEDLAWILERMGVETGLDVKSLAETGLWINNHLGRTGSAQLGVAGRFPRPVNEP